MNVKQRDLAIQIKSVAGNFGSIVEILEWSGDIQCPDGSIDSNCWFVKYPHPTPNIRGEYSEFGYLPDTWLRPVSGLPTEEETDQTEEA